MAAIKSAAPSLHERIDIRAEALQEGIQRRYRYDEFHRLRSLGLLRYYDTDGDGDPGRQAASSAERRRKQREDKAAKQAADAVKYADVRRQAAERAAAKTG